MSSSPVPPPPTPPQRAWTPPPPQPPPQKSSNAIWWVLGIIGGCIVLVMIAGLLVVVTLVHRVKVNAVNNKVEIETPVGSLKMNGDNAHSTGLPIYPGATQDKSQGGASFEVSANGKSAGLAIEKYFSDDPRETVEAWYTKKLGSDFKLKVGTQGDHDQIPGVPINVDSTDVSFVQERPDGARVVALGHHGDGTEITLINAGKKEPQ